MCDLDKMTGEAKAAIVIFAICGLTTIIGLLGVYYMRTSAKVKIAGLQRGYHQVNRTGEWQKIQPPR